MKKNCRSGIVIFVLLGLLACSCQPRFRFTTTFTSDQFDSLLSEVDQIKIYHEIKGDDINRPQLIKTIDTSDEDIRIVNSFKNYSDSWEASGFSPFLNGHLIVDFYHKDEVKLSIMIVCLAEDKVSNDDSGSRQCFLSHRSGGVVQLKPNEFKELMNALQVDEVFAFD